MQPLPAAAVICTPASVRAAQDGTGEQMTRTIDAIVRDGTRPADWPPALADAYREAQDGALYREYRFLLMLGLAICIGTIALDVLLMPSLAAEGTALRLATTLPATAFGLFVGARRWSGALKVALGLAPLVFIAVIAHLAIHLDPQDSARYLLGAALVMGIACVTTPLPVRGLALFNASAVIVVGTAIAIGAPARFTTYLPDLLTMAMLAIATLALAVRVERLRRNNFLLALRGELVSHDLVEANRALRELSDTDPLTGVGNRRWFETEFARTIESPRPRAGDGAGSGQWIGLMMIDLDHFKPFNDHHGHQAGDSCLRLVAGSLREVFEQSDALFARYGGEEFIAALATDDPATITALAEEARRTVASRLAPIEGGGRALITASIGVALSPASFGLMREELIEMADAALYSGKNAGRNRVELVEAGPAGPCEERVGSFG